MSRDLSKKRLRDTYKVLERDGKGIPTDDLVRAIQALNFNPCEKDIEYLLKHGADFDKNDDDYLNYEEFCAMVETFDKTHPLTPEEELRNAFKLFDTDNNGKLSRDELESIMLNLGEKLTLKELDDMIREVDENKDGFIDIDEFIKKMTIMMGKS